jgi:hypothetical protein
VEWATIVQAVNDPRHEQYKENRDWPGLLPGDTLDPEAFAVDAVNEELAEPF